MITLDGERGRYPAISITGKKCELSCLHCRGHLLQDMYHCESPEELLRTLRKLEEEGMEGALISGGCDLEGRMPWDRFLPSLLDFRTKLFISCHAGLYVSEEIAKLMGKSVISQALIDVVGDPETWSEIYRLRNYGKMEETLYNLFSYGPTVVPHIVVGIYYGRIKGEYRALEMLRPFKPRLVTLVVLMPSLLGVSPPPIDEVVEVFRAARSLFEEVALGCARPRGRYRYELEERLIGEGLIDRIAIWSDRAIDKARKLGYHLRFHYTCCSVMRDDTKGNRYRI